MANYTDNPSMDEILTRIKKALAERERRIDEMQDEQVSDFSVAPVRENVSENIPLRDASEPLTTEEIFIKPNLNSENKDVFVLTKSMKVEKVEKLQTLDAKAFMRDLAFAMAKELDMGYMAPKMESWLLNNFWEYVAKNQKK